MRSPAVEWSLAVGHLAVLDWIRDRGEPDRDTLSEVIRETFHVDTPAGRAVFTAVLGLGAVAFHRHICK